MVKLRSTRSGGKFYRRKEMRRMNSSETMKFGRGGGVYVVNRREVGHEEKCVSSRGEIDKGTKKPEESKWE